mmetsp:Transcript_12560/g.31646  ORF Transcript_12560/g.31646 Transcript_12560/m.31646 type:complete len:93 (+) Transcript_12560:367-645(+)
MVRDIAGPHSAAPPQKEHDGQNESRNPKIVAVQRDRRPSLGTVCVRQYQSRIDSRKKGEGSDFQYRRYHKENERKPPQFMGVNALYYLYFRR